MLNQNFVITWTVVGLIVMAFICVRKKYGFAKTLLYLLFIVYVGVVIDITLFPVPIDHRLPPTGSYFNNYNLIPFAGIAKTLVDADGLSRTVGFDGWSLAIMGIAGNILMFVPLGFMLPYISDKLKKFKKALLLIFCCSLLIEFTQLGIGIWAGYLYRVVDVDDLILNTLGGVFGFLIYWLITKLFCKLKFKTKQSKRQCSVKK